LTKEYKKINLIVFVRAQTWDNYEKKDTTKIDQIQIDFIDEILESTEDKVLGRWRYKFDRFSDIVSVLETNQNGLFIDLTRKQYLYKKYLHKEFLEIYRIFFSKYEGQLKCITDLINLPDIEFHGDFFQQQEIDRPTKSMILLLIGIFQNKSNLIQKIQRIFIYIAQGEFSYFDAKSEKYTQPEYIKLAIQTGEMIEKTVHTFSNIDVFASLKSRFLGNNPIYTISKSEYNMFVKTAYSDIETFIAKLTNLVNFFESGVKDLVENNDDFYAYRGVINDSIKNEELINYAKDYFNK
jgi:hypothetical protein